MPQNTDPANSGELSPVKRALVEIRQLRAELEASRAARREPIAILGMALRLPGGVTTPQRFWQALADGEDLIGTVPPDRWEASEYLHADPDHPGTMYDAHGGFLDCVDAFDAEFFGINPREAAGMDPQQRLLLELTWEALERAAIDPKTLANTPAGVYLGISGSDYARHWMRDARAIEAYSAVGSAPSIAAGRISYFLALRGPSLVVDTACSSSLVAVQLAVEGLRRGETNLAIVGGSNLILDPGCNVSFARTRMLSRDGRSKAFDAAADGYVRSEGCCVLVLKRLSDALRDGDRVLACIAGLAVNQDGRSAGITAPNGPAQEALIRAALANAGLEPAAVSYVEAHGTGTPLGDPIEAQALGAVYGMARGADQPLRIGSVKTNLGHTEAASGLVGLIKVVLMMQPGHGIAPQLHFQSPNPKIDFERLRIEVATRMTCWPQSEGPLYAGVSSFGFSGTNAHLLLASAPAVPLSPVHADERTSLLMLSATSAAALRESAVGYVPFLEKTKERFEDICFTAAVGRTRFAHRLALRARSSQAAVSMLAQWLRGEAVEGLAAGTVESQEPESVLAGIEKDELGQWQSESLRRVELPVYPFARTRFWFGPAPEEKRAQEREQAWRTAIAAAQGQSLQGPLGWKLDRYPEKFTALDRLALAHARNVLAGANLFQGPRSLDEVMAQAGFQPLYRNLVGRWLNGLAAANVLAEEGGRFRAVVSFTPVPLEPYWRDAERLLEDEPGTLAYLKQCGSLLPDILTGRVSALETLFPQGAFELAEELYRTGATARYFNSIVAAAIANIVAGIGQRRNARILEVGGGTGGTTSAVLPLLPSGQVEYWFTDLSELFLARARGRFSAYPFMHYAIFDLDRALEKQRIGSGQFDVILGANVFHAARNLTAALAQVRRLLAPGGILVLTEITHHHRWFDMTLGLLEGWQHFEDERQGHPLLTLEQWPAFLERSGFSEVAVFPAADTAGAVAPAGGGISPVESPASILGQHVLLARPSAGNMKTRQSKSGQQSISAWKPQAEDESGEPVKTNVAARPEATLKDLHALPAAARKTALLRVIEELARKTLSLDARQEINPEEPLSELGMDSLLAIELRSCLSTFFAKRLPSTLIFDYPTLRALAGFIDREVFSPASENNVTNKSTNSVAPGSVRPLGILDQIEQLSDEEVDALIEKDANGIRRS